MTPEQIGEAVRNVNSEFDGFGGNCARFAAVLNRVLGGEGTYVIVDGGHYEYADHVALLHGGFVYDGNGMSDMRGFEEAWCGDGEQVEEFLDASEDGDDVRRLAGEGFSARWDEDSLEAALRAALFPSPRP